jgi:hypothetical protein
MQQTIIFCVAMKNKTAIAASLPLVVRKGANRARRPVYCDCDATALRGATLSHRTARADPLLIATAMALLRCDEGMNTVHSAAITLR